MGDLPPPQPSPSGGVKRDRDSDTGSPCSTHASFSPSSTQSHEGPRTIAGSRRVNRGGSPGSRPYPSTNLPVYTNDLGKLPIHGQVNLPMPSPPQSAAPSAGQSAAAVWYPQHHAHPHAPAHQHQHQPQLQHQHHLTGAENPPAHLTNMSNGAGLPYPPTVPSHSAQPQTTVYPVSEHVFNGSNGRFEYGSAHHTPSPPATAFFGASEANHEFHVTVDSVAPGVHHPPHTHTHHHAALPVPTAAPASVPPLLNRGPSLVDSDTITMWSNAPSGFEYVYLFVVFHGPHLFWVGSAIGACI